MLDIDIGDFADITTKETSFTIWSDSLEKYIHDLYIIIKSFNVVIGQKYSGANRLTVFTFGFCLLYYQFSKEWALYLSSDQCDTDD